MVECVGVLVIRAWCESGRDEPFRARVLEVGTSLDQLELVALTSSRNQVVDVVRDWLGGTEPCRSE
jgi:hypothetical protein